MSLIRSEHLNDQAVREAKEAVDNAETALEEARAQLEKRERAQYHEEQIWSDTIRRNSTWVTFGLMGVNIFLLLLSLAVLEPWRRRRMVREIKNALEAQKTAIEAGPASAVAAATASAKQDLAAIEEAIETTTPAPKSAPVEIITAVAEQGIAESPTTATPSIEVVPIGMPESAAHATSTSAPPTLVHLDADTASVEEVQATLDNLIEEPSSKDDTRTWTQKISAVAHDVVSDRIVSMRRIDYTAAILQGAAAGAVITAAIVAMLRPN
jgi:sensitive to high expression protein 9